MSGLACEHNKINDVSKDPKLVLWFAFGINLFMFFVEQVYGWIAESRALLGDSVDMLGDSGFYLITILAIGKTPIFGARAAFVKGIFMSFFTLVALVSIVYQFYDPKIPEAEIIGFVGVLALLANLICAAVLMGFRDKNINMKSMWICTRNDVLANIGVLIAGAGVALTSSPWPDLIIGGVIGLLIMKSSIQILKESKKEIKRLHELPSVFKSF
jgi:Co/Zn/Cd efflux system component